MRRSVFADQPCPVEAHHDVQMLERHVVDYVIVGPLHERRINIAERDHAGRSQPGRERDGMSLGYADVEATLRHLGHHPIQRASGRHRGRNADDTVVDPCELQNRLAENILIERGTAAFGMLHPLPGLGIEYARRMPYPLVLFGRPVALALDRQHMQQLRPGYLLQIAQHAGQLDYVVPVDGPEIAEVQALEQVALL